MAEFKVGQWVRALVNWGGIEAGKVYQIPYLDADGEPWFNRMGAGWTDYLTLSEIEPWTPRVGDRVKMIKRVDNLKADCGATVVHNDGGSYQPILIEFDEKQRLGHTGCDRTKDGYGWWVSANDIEPLPIAEEAQPAEEAEPLKLQIEAGKFYKTRDGRKVGPMAHYYRDRWIVAYGDGNVWLSDGSPAHRSEGKYMSDGGALVAEWVEPASNDNAPAAELPVEKPKFKVGDVVTPSHGLSKSTATVTKADDDCDIHVRWNNGASGSVVGWTANELELVAPVAPTPAIVALIEDGQPKPSHRPHVHASAELAAKEADRLAEKFKGKQFGVYVLSSTSEKAKPAYEHQ